MIEEEEKSKNRVKIEITETKYIYTNQNTLWMETTVVNRIKIVNDPSNK